MKILYNPELVRQNEDDQTVFFTLTDDDGMSYQWHCDAPKGVDVQAYLDSNMEKFLLLIRRREFPEATRGRDYEVSEDQTDLEAIEKFIAAGCNLKDDQGQIIGQAARVPWKSTHPEKIPAATLDKINRATTVADLRDALIEIFIDGKPKSNRGRHA